VDLATFRLESWLALVDGEPSEKFIEQSGGACPVERWRQIEAMRMWADARNSWADSHEWPGGSVAQLREQWLTRRAQSAAWDERNEHDGECTAG